MNSGQESMLRASRLNWAFTLIELLVVITIISILFAMLLPALNQVKDRTKLMECRHRQHQLFVMYALYAGDNDGIYPWTKGGRFPRALFGLPSGFSLNDYGPFELTPPYNFLTDNINSFWNCLGDETFGVGVQIVVGQQGSCTYLPAGTTNSCQLPDPGGVPPANAAATGPCLSGNRNVIRRAGDAGDTDKSQAFFTCFGESYGGLTAYVEYASHDWAFGTGIARGVTTWSDGHATTYFSQDTDYRIMFNQGSSSLWWDEEVF